MIADVILAADILDLNRLRTLIKLPISGVKLGFATGLTYGLPNMVELIQEINPALNIVYDHQKGCTDIPKMMELFVEVIRIAGINEAILFPLSGLKTLEQALKYCEEYNVKPWIGLSMSHEGFNKEEGGWINEEDFFNSTFDFVNAEFPEFNNFVIPSNRRGLLDRIVDPCEVLITGISQEGRDISAINRLCLRINTEGSINVNVVLGSALYEASDPEKILENFKYL